jgi:hypothetical protein
MLYEMQRIRLSLTNFSGNNDQCCQLLADFSGEFGGKIRPASNIPFLNAFFAFRNKIIFVCVSRKSIIFFGHA